MLTKTINWLRIKISEKHNALKKLKLSKLLLLTRRKRVRH